MVNAKATIVPFLIIGLTCVVLLSYGMTIAEPDIHDDRKNEHWHELIDDLNEHGGKIYYLSYASAKSTSTYTCTTVGKGAVQDAGDGLIILEKIFIPYARILSISVF